MKIFIALLAIIIGLVFAPKLLSPTPDNGSGTAVTGLPWQIDILPDGGSRVFGLTLDHSSLQDVRQHMGEGEMALVAAPNEAVSLEIFFDMVTIGGAITGKLVAKGNLPEPTIAAMHQRAAKTEYMQSSTKKSQLAANDVAAAYAAPVHTMAFIPSASLDNDTLIKLFGAPAERIRAGESAEYLLYPERGLAITLDTEGKEVLQYIAPRNFAQLQKTLKSQPAPVAAK